MSLFSRVDCNVSGTRNNDALAVKRSAASAEHFLREVDEAVTGCLGSREGASPGQALASENTSIEAVAQTAVLAEKVTDLATTNTNVACRNVSIGTDVTLKFGHEGLAKTHDFSVGLTLGVKVRTALRTAHRQAGQRVLKDLLKTQELNNGQVYRRVEAQTALVGAKS